MAEQTRLSHDNPMLSAGGKTRVLLADANPGDLSALRSILEDFGTYLVEAYSSDEVIARLNAFDFAVILLDVNVPGLGGFSTAKAIRADERYRSIPIIFVTADDLDQGQVEVGYELGAVDFFVKPFVPAVVRAKVRGFVTIFEEKQRSRADADQLRLLIQATTDYAIFMLDPQGHVVSWNTGAERIKQYKASEIIGHHFSRFYPKEALDRDWPAHELRVAKAEGRFEDEGWRLRKDGTKFWANVVITALNDEAGSFRGFSKITRDLSERKKSEENARRLLEEATARHVAEQNAGLIQQQKELLRVTLASISEAVIATDTQRLVTFLNGVAQELTGWTQEDAKGQPLDSVFVALNEENRLPVESPIKDVLAGGGIVGVTGHIILIARDGTERPIDDSAAPIRDATGNVIGVVLTFRDVTERRRHEREVWQSEARKSAVLNTALDCIITIDHEGNVLEFNQAAEKTFGYSREQIVGQELSAFIIPPSLRDQHRAGMAHFLATGDGPVLGKRLELPALRADGTEFPVELAITRIPMEGPPLFTAYLRDITEQKLAEQYRNLRLAVTHALSEASGVDDGARGVLRAVCENVGWELGFFWRVSDQGDRLECLASWHKQYLVEFEDDTFNRSFKLGEGLPGRVWESKHPAWILDVLHDANFSRVAVAAKYGLHSAFAYPIVVGEQMLGVIEFFTLCFREADATLLETMGTVAGSFGQFIERKLAEDAVRRSERELADFFENATIGLHWVGADGIILRANRAELEMLGYSREEYVGRPISDFHADEATINDILRRLQNGEDLHEYPARLKCKDGSLKSVLIDSSVLFQDSEFVHTRCFTRDVTESKRSEVAQRESEEKLRLLADTIPQLAWMAMPDGHIFWYNRRWYEYTGTTPAEMEGWGWQRVHKPEMLPMVLDRWKWSIASGEPFDMVFPLRRADGQFRPFLTRVNPLTDEGGTILYWCGTNTDITELREAREALAVSEERLRLALDAGRMGVWDWNVRTGELKWSDSLEPLHGLSPGTFGGTFDHFQELIYPEDREMVNVAIRQALETGGEFYVEFRNVWQNGGIHWIAGTGKVFLGDDGQPLRMIGIGLDVTQRKRSEQTARFLADASAALAVLVDFDSTLQKVSSLAVPSFADWATVDVAEADGSLRRVSVSHIDPAKVQLAHEVHCRFPPDPAAPKGVWNILRTGRSEIFPEITDELLVQSTNDEELLGIMRQLGLKSYIGVPLKVRGKTLGVITFINAESGHRYDDTDLAVAEDLASRAAIAIENAQLYRELRDADQRKDEFLATLAHELRNPLAPIRNGLQVLRLAGGGGEIVDEARSMMERQLSQMVRLVDDLLDVSRITRNKLELRRERVTLAAVVNSAIETSRPLMEQSGHTFSLKLPPVSVYLDADLTRLAQVFSNLLNNAAKYTEPGGRISLTAGLSGAEVVIRLVDNGMGIPAEALPRIFEMFSQVDRNMERSQGGLGIGLTLVRRLVEMHGGTVEAHSDGPGRGSQFIVRLPILDAASIGATSQSDNGLSVAAKRRILVVDDNRDSATTLGMMLKLMGNDTRTVHDGMAAVEAAEEFRPDMILLDIGLPKLNGYDACRRIREKAWSKGMVIVALTGWGQDEDRRRSQEAGFDHHLVKPVEIATLDALLRENSIPVR